MEIGDRKRIFTRDCEVHFYDCDCYGKMKISSVNKLLADLADADYADKGMSHEWLWENGYVFLLARVSILFDRLPGPRETLRVSTWEREIKGASFFRSYQAHDASGTRILSADSAWMLVNPNTRQILRPQQFSNASPTGIPADCPPCLRLKLEGGEAAGERKVVYSDLDANGHVYNAVYADIAMDVLPDAIRKKELRAYQVNFQSEARLGDTLTLVCCHEKNVYLVKGMLGGKDSFLCSFAYGEDSQV